jgi:thiamine-monophosphate kinase
VTPRLGSGLEFDTIRRIAEALGSRAPDLGDDCAFIESGGEFMAISTDLSVDGVHFQRAWLNPAEIGWRAATAALSDLAAVGARPIGVLASLGVPGETANDYVVALMEGVAAAAGAVGGKVLGGDLSRSPVWTIDVTVIGRVAVPIRRGGAAAGDGIWVTGRLGGARAGLESFRAGQTPPPYLREAFAHPEARVQAGQWLARHGATAMIDLSDGLAGDARHLAAASQVALEIELGRLPLGLGVQETAAHFQEDPHLFAATGGEDYELLVTLPSDFEIEHVTRFEREAGIPLTCIGAVMAGEGARLLLGGHDVTLSGFDHFR